LPLILLNLRTSLRKNSQLIKQATRQLPHYSAYKLAATSRSFTSLVSHSLSRQSVDRSLSSRLVPSRPSRLASFSSSTHSVGCNCLIYLRVCVLTVLRSGPGISSFSARQVLLVRYGWAGNPRISEIVDYPKTTVRVTRLDYLTTLYR